MKLRRFTPEDTEDLIRGTNDFLTSGETVGETIRHCVRDGNYYGFVVEDEGDLVAFQTYKKGIDFTLPKPELTEEIEAKFPGLTLFTGDTMFVGERARHRGIASRFITLTRADIVSRGGDLMMTEQWVYPDGRSPINDLTGKFGELVYEKKIPGFYKDLGKYGMRCSICGDNCKCGAVIKIHAVKYREGETPDEYSENEKPW